MTVKNKAEETKKAEPVAPASEDLVCAFCLVFCCKLKVPNLSFCFSYSPKKTNAFKKN